MEDIKTQLANRLKEASNVLVTVASNPTVDQLSAAIALTLILNKLGKHGTAVFSGSVPSTIEFLHPEKTLEKNTDSLRDFIISLDKAKADKLRYKIEDQFVKIFITPYHTSIDEKDLVFSQGDFNVDVVVALGVHKREELDNVITAHGRILHDATVSTVNTVTPSTLGSINWSDKNSSSLCEMIVFLTDSLAKEGLLDAQVSNALLTGIVAETQRFSNQKTTSLTMSASSRLLAAGANQQLVATALQPPPPKPAPAPAPPAPKPVASAPPAPKPVPPPSDKPNDKGEIQIDHGQPTVPMDMSEDDEQSNLAQVQIDDQGTFKVIDPREEAEERDRETEAILANSAPATPTVPTAEPDSKEPDKPDTNEKEAVKEATSALGAAPAGSYMSAPPKSLDDNFLEPLSDDDNEDASNMPTAKPPLLSHDAPLANEAEEKGSASDLSAERGAVENAFSSGPGQDFMAPIESLNSQTLGDSINTPPASDDKPEKEDDEGNKDSSSSAPPPVAPPLVPPPQI